MKRDTCGGTVSTAFDGWCGVMAWLGLRLLLAVVDGKDSVGRFDLKGNLS